MVTATFPTGRVATSLLTTLLLAQPSVLTSSTLAAEPSGVRAAGYGATIDNVWTSFDVWRGGERGMEIHLRFRTSEMQGWSCKAIAYFSYDDGDPLEDFDGLYTTTDGQVAASTAFTPTYQYSTFSDLRIFIPYAQLHMASGRSALQYRVELHTTGGSLITSSRRVSFEFDKD